MYATVQKKTTSEELASDFSGTKDIANLGLSKVRIALMGFILYAERPEWSDLMLEKTKLTMQVNSNLSAFVDGRTNIDHIHVNKGFCGRKREMLFKYEFGIR